MTIGITGGTGFVGRALTQALLQAGHRVTVFSRSPKAASSPGAVAYAAWDPAKKTIDTAALQALDACVHLAGAGVADKRWTDARKREIVHSRVDGTSFLVDALKRHAPACKTLVSASAIGWYGPDPAPGGGAFGEDDRPGADFLATTCVQWEAAAAPAAASMRLVLPRFGIVLGHGGGAYPQFVRSLPFRVETVLGSGEQVMSWIHLDDLVGMLVHALTQESVSGVYNAVAPHPVAHKALMDALADAHGGPHLPLPVPEVALKLLLGEMSTEVLKSCTVSARKITDAGFAFRFPTIAAAATALQGASA